MHHACHTEWFFPRCGGDDDRSADYSERLGVLDDQQFQAALARWNLGDFVRAGPITGGLLGQNVFVTSTTGNWVWRGVPHYDWHITG